jgi:gliding motility-associated-like protein
MPGSDNLFFIFTSDAIDVLRNKGYNYHVVDISKQGNLGEVIIKNRFLHAPSTEKMTVARHCNGKDWWVITKQFGNNLFYTYLVDSNGVNSTPVISTVGAVLDSGPQAVGALKISPDGRKLAMVMLKGATEWQVMDFDNVTGKISNAVQLSGYTNSYGLEFSPNSAFLYITHAVPGGDVLNVDQYDVTSYSDAAGLMTTRVTIKTYKDFEPRGMQLGPDKRIYITRYYKTSLDVILSPDEKGVNCNLQEGLQSLGAIRCTEMLTSLVTDLVVSSVEIISDIEAEILDTCKRLVKFRVATNPSINVTCHWLFDDETTSELPEPVKTFDLLKDTFNVKVEISFPVSTNCTSSQILFKKVSFNAYSSQAQASFTHTIPCKGEVVQFTNTSVSASGTIAGYSWLFGDGTVSRVVNPSHIYYRPGIYQVKLQAYLENGCVSAPFTKSIEVEEKMVSAGPDTVIAFGQPLKLQGSGALEYEWQPSQYLDSSRVPNPIAFLQHDQLFTLKGTYAQGCIGFDDVLVKMYKGPEIYVPNAFSPNGDYKNDILHVVAPGVSLHQFMIYNRWGNLVYACHNTNEIKWDGMYKGKMQPTGTFVWMAIGTDYKGVKIVRKGTVTLIK